MARGIQAWLHFPASRKILIAYPADRHLRMIKMLKKFSKAHWTFKVGIYCILGFLAGIWVFAGLNEIIPNGHWADWPMIWFGVFIELGLIVGAIV